MSVAYDIGHNSGAAPLEEFLSEESAPLRQRALDLIAGATRAAVTDEDSAGKATLLAKMMADHIKTIDAAREERKKPFLESGRTVDRVYNGLKDQVHTTRAKVVDLIDAYRKRKEAEAAAERKRLQEEADRQRRLAEQAERDRLAAEAKAQREAEEAQRKIREAQEEAARAGNRAAAAEAARAQAELDRQESERRQAALQAEMDARAAADRAAETEAAAAAVTAAPIDSGYGAKASGRKVFKVEITDLTAAIKHARRIDEAAIIAAVQTVFERQVKAGVRTLPGAEVIESTQTVIR